MDKKYKFILLDFIGVLFLLFGIIAISNSMYNQNPMQILFLCYIGLILMGFGILTKRSYLVMSQVYILLIPHLLWTIDFFYQLILNKPLWGVTDYFFIDNFFIIGNIISLQHIFAIPIALYAVSLIGLKRKDVWILSFVQITIIYILVSLLTLSETNINCVFSSCINVHFGVPWIPYRLTWFIAIFLMTFFSSVLLNLIPLIKVKNDKKNKR